MKTIVKLVCYILPVVIVCSICYIFLFGNFNTAKVNISDVNTIKVMADVSEAYYLTNSGVLYSPGADIDASCYVSYKDRKKGVVGENVIDFGTMLCGGYYLTKQNELWVYNSKDIPLFNYSKKGQTKILDNVTFAKIYNKSLVYTDKENNLYLIGEFNNEQYPIDSPKLLANNVSIFDVCNDRIIWLSGDDTLGSYGKIDISENHNGIKNIKKISVTSNSIVILADCDLWYYGDYDRLVGKSGNKSDCVLLATDIIDFACDSKKVVAISNNHSAYLWGEYLSNDSYNTEIAEYGFFEKQNIINNVLSVTVNNEFICFATKDYKSCVYGFGDSWGFYGNTTDANVVGINNKPIMWK